MCAAWARTSGSLPVSARAHTQRSKCSEGALKWGRSWTWQEYTPSAPACVRVWRGGACARGLTKAE